MSRRRRFRPPVDDGARPVRDLVVVFSDQLDPKGLDSLRLDRRKDLVLLVEAADELGRGPAHRQRIALHLAAMRHFADGLARRRRHRLEYRALDDVTNRGALDAEISAAIERFRPARLRALRPGSWRLLNLLRGQAEAAGLELEVAEEPHFLETPGAFVRWARSTRRVRPELLYRRIRKRLHILLDADGGPEGRRWSFDRDSHNPWRRGSPRPPQPRRFPPDELTREVLEIVAERFPEAPGQLEPFGWPVTRTEALAALEDFVANRLGQFGTYRDALATGRPWLFHSLLSPALNLKLLDPRDCVAAALDAYRGPSTPLQSVECFLREIIGWREFARGVYWLEGPEYAERNELGQHGRLPPLYRTADTDMHCLRDAVGRVLQHGYGHRAQRLAVTGNFALLSGIEPRALAEWTLATHVDAVEWATVPETMGLALYADGGVVADRPDPLSGLAIRRRGDACRDCRFDPRRGTGEDACPFTTFYQEFLDRHRERFSTNPRMRPMMSDLERLDPNEIEAVRERARELREELGIGAVDGGAS